MTRRFSTLIQQPEPGDFIRDLRQDLGLTQEKFVAKVEVTFPTVNRWENKRAQPSPLTMEKIEVIARELSDQCQEAVAKI